MSFSLYLLFSQLAVIYYNNKYTIIALCDYHFSTQTDDIKIALLWSGGLVDNFVGPRSNYNAFQLQWIIKGTSLTLYCF